jgi:hypothetical protein
VLQARLEGGDCVAGLHGLVPADRGIDQPNAQQDGGICPDLDAKLHDNCLPVLQESGPLVHRLRTPQTQSLTRDTQRSQALTASSLEDSEEKNRAEFHRTMNAHSYRAFSSFRLPSSVRSNSIEHFQASSFKRPAIQIL